MKAASQIDFILAVGIFLIAIFFVVNYMTDFIEPLKEVSDHSQLSARARLVLDGVQREHGSLGLMTTAYQTTIVLENTRDHLINSSHAIIDLTNEAVKLNLTGVGFSVVDRYSVAVYNDSDRRTSINYTLVGSIVVFNASVRADSARTFTLTFDDDSSFPDRTQFINATNRLNEVVSPVSELRVIQRRKIDELRFVSVDELRYVAAGNVRIVVSDGVNGETIIVGELPPQRTDVVVMDASVLVQAGDATIHEGSVQVTVW